MEKQDTSNAWDHDESPERDKKMTETEWEDIMRNRIIEDEKRERTIRIDED